MRSILWSVALCTRIYERIYSLLRFYVINSDDQKFVEIMTNYDMKATAKFVYQAFNEREIRLDVLSTLNEIVSSTEILLKNVNQNTSHPGTTDIYQVKWCSNDGLKLRLSKI